MHQHCFILLRCCTICCSKNHQRIFLWNPREKVQSKQTRQSSSRKEIAFASRSLPARNKESKMFLGSKKVTQVKRLKSQQITSRHLFCGFRRFRWVTRKLCHLVQNILHQVSQQNAEKQTTCSEFIFLDCRMMHKMKHKNIISSFSYSAQPADSRNVFSLARASNRKSFSQFSFQLVAFSSVSFTCLNHRHRSSRLFIEYLNQKRFSVRGAIACWNW